MKNKTSKAQIKASAKWNKNNREKMKYIRYKSNAKVFVEKLGEIEDIEELKKIIEKKLEKI